VSSTVSAVVARRSVPLLVGLPPSPVLAARRSLHDPAAEGQQSRRGYNDRPRGPLAQLVEQGTLNPKVAGSIPARPTPGLPVNRHIAQAWTSALETQGYAGSTAACRENFDSSCKPALAALCRVLYGLLLSSSSLLALWLLECAFRMDPRHERSECHANRHDESPAPREPRMQDGDSTTSRCRYRRPPSRPASRAACQDHG
jgi:hypothetical protein